MIYGLKIHSRGPAWHHIRGYNKEYILLYVLSDMVYLTCTLDV